MDYGLNPRCVICKKLLNGCLGVHNEAPETTMVCAEFEPKGIDCKRCRNNKRGAYCKAGFDKGFVQDVKTNCAGFLMYIAGK